MGLDLHINGYESENSKIGSYTGFHLFRVAWAKHLGFDLEEMEGFKGTKNWTSEPLKFFFFHSDCDGHITPKQAEKLLIQAEKDYPTLKDTYPFSYSFPVLIEFCKEAIKRNKRINFC